MSRPITFAHVSSDGSYNLHPSSWGEQLSDRVDNLIPLGALGDSLQQVPVPLQDGEQWRGPSGRSEDFEDGVDISNGVVIAESRLSGGGQIEDSQG